MHVSEIGMFQRPNCDIQVHEALKIVTLEVPDWRLQKCQSVEIWRF